MNQNKQKASIFITFAECILVILLLLLGGFIDHYAFGKGKESETQKITLDMDRLPHPDCWYETSFMDQDGKPGGPKMIDIEPLCPEKK